MLQAGLRNWLINSGFIDVGQCLFSGGKLPPGFCGRVVKREVICFVFDM